MKNRFIAGIIAFVLTFAVSVALVWVLFGLPEKPKSHHCQDHADSIYSLLVRDISNGSARNKRSSRGSDRSPEDVDFLEIRADAVARYVEESGSMDASHLPHDFQVAWKRHMDAWRNYSEFLNNSKANSDFEDFYDAETPYNIEINETWDEVLRIAESYGAYIR